MSEVASLGRVLVHRGNPPQTLKNFPHNVPEFSESGDVV